MGERTEVKKLQVAALDKTLRCMRIRTALTPPYPGMRSRTLRRT